MFLGHLAAAVRQEVEHTVNTVRGTNRQMAELQQRLADAQTRGQSDQATIYNLQVQLHNLQGAKDQLAIAESYINEMEARHAQVGEEQLYQIREWGSLATRTKTALDDLQVKFVNLKDVLNQVLDAHHDAPPSYSVATSQQAPAHPAFTNSTFTAQITGQISAVTAREAYPTPAPATSYNPFAANFAPPTASVSPLSHAPVYPSATMGNPYSVAGAPFSFPMPTPTAAPAPDTREAMMARIKARQDAQKAQDQGAASAIATSELNKVKLKAQENEKKIHDLETKLSGIFTARNTAVHDFLIKQDTLRLSMAQLMPTFPMPRFPTTSAQAEAWFYHAEPMNKAIWDELSKNAKAALDELRQLKPNINLRDAKYQAPDMQVDETVYYSIALDSGSDSANKAVWEGKARPFF